MVAGGPTLRAGFRAVRREILTRSRPRETLREEVGHMRERMRKELGSTRADAFDLKQDRGGIADIEFTVQYGVLAGASGYAGLLRYTDNIRLLDELERAGEFTAGQTQILADAYRHYRGLVHRLTLQEQPTRVDPDEVASVQSAVSAVWARVMGEGAGAA